MLVSEFKKKHYHKNKEEYVLEAGRIITSFCIQEKSVFLTQKYSSNPMLRDSSTGIRMTDAG